MNYIPAQGCPNSNVRFVQNNPMDAIRVINKLHLLIATLTTVPGTADRMTIEQRAALYAAIETMNDWQDAMKGGAA